MKCLPMALSLIFSAFCANAEVQVIGGKTYECKDGLCRLVEGDAEETPLQDEDGSAVAGGGDAASALRESVRMAQGYMPEEEFIAFLENRPTDRLGESGLWLTLILVLLGGLAMNLTPCVLPMVPINLMIIGKSARRGLAYGLGIALAYGALGVAAAVGGLAFGAIQGSPWFNAVVALVFVALALALFDVWFLDLSWLRRTAPRGEDVAGAAFAFGMGALSAVLAGACVAPVLVSVLLLTADLVAKGNRLALFLPFVMGVGLALPWPFAGAGMKVLPKPGGWMKWVNRAFGVVVLGFASWYGWLAWQGWRGNGDASSAAGGEGAASPVVSLSRPASLASRLESAPRPVLVDCWATWCKNCTAMERVMERPRVREALKPFAVIRMQAEDIGELRGIKGFESVRGLPAFVIFE